jgi:hypothetical protein
MGPLINLLVLLVLLFAGLAQARALPPRVAYAIAVALAVIAFTLAIALPAGQVAAHSPASENPMALKGRTRSGSPAGPPRRCARGICGDHRAVRRPRVVHHRGGALLQLPLRSAETSRRPTLPLRRRVGS